MADLSLRYRQGAPRIYGLATVPLAEPDAAADELNRAVRDLGFRGVKIYPSFSGLPLLAPEVRLLMEEAARLGAVVLT
ncbi:MAG: amidohydrolase family protein, partial [Bacillota bacterium]